MNITQNLQDYWREVRALEKSLPETVVIVSTEQKYNKEHVAGRVVAISRYYGAKHILNGTHRLANKEEIAKYESDMFADMEDAKALAIEAKGIHIHMPSGETVKAETTKKGK